MILVGVRPLQKEKEILQGSHFLPDRIIAEKLLGIFQIYSHIRKVVCNVLFRMVYKTTYLRFFFLLFQRRKSVSPEKNLHLK